MVASWLHQHHHVQSLSPTSRPPRPSTRRPVASITTRQIDTQLRGSHTAHRMGLGCNSSLLIESLQTQITAKMAEPSSQQQPAASTQDQQPEQQETEQPGPRATRLQELYALSVKKTLSKLDWDNFAGCYPTIAKRAEPVLKEVQERTVASLGQRCNVCSPSHLSYVGCDFETDTLDFPCLRRTNSTPSSRPETSSPS